MRTLTAALFMMALWPAGCGVFRPVDRSGRERSAPSPYELAWVDPQIVITDSLFTLIRADRIDSFYVGLGAGRGEVAPPSLMFQITRGECITTANIMNDQGQVVTPLVVQRLPNGYYKLTLEWRRFTAYGPFESPRYLQATFCDSTIAVPLEPGR